MNSNLDDMLSEFSVDIKPIIVKRPKQLCLQNDKNLKNNDVQTNKTPLVLSTSTIKRIPLSNGVIYSIPIDITTNNSTNNNANSSTKRKKLIIRTDNKVPRTENNDINDDGCSNSSNNVCGKNDSNITGKNDVNMVSTSTQTELNSLSKVIDELEMNIHELKKQNVLLKRQYDNVLTEDCLKKEEIIKLKKIIEHQNNYIQSIEKSRQKFMFNSNPILNDAQKQSRKNRKKIK